MAPAAGKGGAADVTGHISLGGIYAYIDKALGSWEQRPVFKTNVTRFTSLKDVVPQINISIIRNICTYFEEENSVLPLDPSLEPTNTPADHHELLEPYATEQNMKIFAELQKLEGVGLVVPVEEEHMYFAAMRSKGCELTSIGKQYWRQRCYLREEMKMAKRRTFISFDLALVSNVGMLMHLIELELNSEQEDLIG